MEEADARFPVLAGHGERAASYAVACAQAMNVPFANLRSLRVAAALHYATSVPIECPCCGSRGKRVSLEIDDRRASDYVHGMFSDWNMVALESSILAAACRFDLEKIGISADVLALRPGVQEAMNSVSEVITPLYEI
jgi:hypothetical protein